LAAQGGATMVIKGQSDIEVHISDIGYICLKQANGDAISQLQEFAQRKFEKSEFVED
jgi:hypothetical protein